MRNDETENRLIQRRSVIDTAALPPLFPTHRHDGSFWEALGRTVATFGFLEKVLGKAIFAFTGTRPIHEDEIDDAYAKWLPTLERALSDPLGNLIDVYGKSVRYHPGSTISNLEELIADLKNAADIRNVLCHGSWRSPNADGASVPFFVNRKMMVFSSEIDVAYLMQVQMHVADLSCAVVNSVTHMGWQFPGGAGPGKPIL
jgi:hypothetical protein